MAMYERHFGLSKRPLCDKVVGSDVFIGPQAAGMIAGLKKALVRADAVVTVSGPAGSGKTTLIGKALTTLGPAFKPIAIGRMHLTDSEVIEYLLEALGVSQPPQGVARRFATFRKVLAAVQAENMRVVVIVEDAIHTGVGVLAELEALTAADSGLSDGANLVLMGNESLGRIMRDPLLERLAQRLRHRQRVAPMSVAEMRGYLIHAFRRAGGEFSVLFDSDSIRLLHALCGGIPRMVNNVAEAALSAAAASGNRQIDAELLAAVAKDEFGLDTEVPAGTSRAPELVVEAGPAFDTRFGPLTTPKSVQAPAPQSATRKESGLQHGAAQAGPVPEPVIVFSNETADQALPEDDISEQIQDTLRKLDVLSKKVAAGAENDSVEDTAEALATMPTPEVDPTPLAEWERDPTVAELRPDLDALEAALANSPSVADEDDDDIGVARPEPEVIPEITLDNAIKQRIEDSLIDEPGHVSPARKEEPAGSTKSADIPEVRLAPRQTRKADAELERIASELARAKTIEDVDGKLAETLFGEEVNLVAARVVANDERDESANDEDIDISHADAARRAEATGYGPGAEEPPAEGTFDVLLDTPDSIEDQIMTSMTQTLKALNVLPPVLNARHQELDDDEPDDKKGGFFSRFRR